MSPKALDISASQGYIYYSSLGIPWSVEIMPKASRHFIASEVSGVKGRNSHSRPAIATIKLSVHGFLTRRESILHSHSQNSNQQGINWGKPVRQPRPQKKNSSSPNNAFSGLPAFLISPRTSQKRKANQRRSGECEPAKATRQTGRISLWKCMRLEYVCNIMSFKMSHNMM